MTLRKIGILGSSGIKFEGISLPPRRLLYPTIIPYIIRYKIMWWTDEESISQIQIKFKEIRRHICGKEQELGLAKSPYCISHHLHNNTSNFYKTPNFQSNDSAICSRCGFARSLHLYRCTREKYDVCEVQNVIAPKHHMVFSSEHLLGTVWSIWSKPLSLRVFHAIN